MEENLLVGVSVVDITPEIGGQLFGYRPDIYSKSINDNLTLGSIFISSNNNDALLISASLCLISTELSIKIRGLLSKELDLPFENIILSATHTHSGPNTCGIFGWGGLDEKYCDDILIPRAIESAKKAKAERKKALVGSSALWSKAGVNRRRCEKDGRVVLAQAPWEAFDGNMTVVDFKDDSGRPIASLVHYGMHGTCAGTDPIISRDWVGVMTDRLEKHSKAPVLFFNGSLGDVGPRLSNQKTVGTIEDIYETGSVAALDAIRAYNKIKHYRYEELKIVSGDVKLNLGKRIPLDLSKEELEKMGHEKININGRKADFYRRTIRSYEENLPEQKDFIIKQTIISLGALAFIPLPFEIFSDISLRLREYSSFAHCLCLGVSNGHFGYLPSAPQICRGGYEVDFFKTESVYPFLDNTDDILIGEILKLMEGL